MAKDVATPTAREMAERWLECFGACFPVAKVRGQARRMADERKKRIGELRTLTKGLVEAAARLGVETRALRDLAKNVEGANRGTLDDSHIAVRDIRAALSARGTSAASVTKTKTVKRAKAK